MVSQRSRARGPMVTFEKPGAGSPLVDVAGPGLLVHRGGCRRLLGCVGPELVTSRGALTGGVASWSWCSQRQRASKCWWPEPGGRRGGGSWAAALIECPNGSGPGVIPPGEGTAALPSRGPTGILGGLGAGGQV